MIDPFFDTRPEFKTAQFKEGVEKISDLEEGMVLEGTVTNVTNFGAFVDVGVHQDGLVHISALSNTFVKDPRDVVKAGDIVNVKVMEVDVQRKRIGLSMRLDDQPGQAPSTSAAPGAGRGNNHNKANRSGGKRGNNQKPQQSSMGTMGALLQQAMKNKK